MNQTANTTTLYFKKYDISLKRPQLVKTKYHIYYKQVVLMCSRSDLLQVISLFHITEDVSKTVMF